MSAAWESFHHAALELVAAGPIKQRLIDAFSKHLKHIGADELPDAVQGQFLTLSKRLTEVCPLRGESAVLATVRKMSNDEASDCARQIVRLLADMERHAGGSSAARPRARSRGLVSLYSAEAAEA